jgi:hypothetical protein
VQLYVAASNYAKWAPEGYNAVADVKVCGVCAKGGGGGGVLEVKWSCY